MSVSIAPSETLASLNERAKLSMNAGQWQKAEADYVELINRFASGEQPPPEHPEVSLCETLNQLGICAIRQNRLSEAVECFQSAIQHCPEDWRAFANIGQLFEVSNRVEDALEFMKLAAELAPDQTIPVQTLAKVATKHGRQVAVVDQMRAAIYHAPNDDNILRTLVDGLIGVGKKSGGKKQLRADNEEATRLYELGAQAHEADRQKEAEDTLLKAIQLCPERAEPFFKLGEVYNATHRFEEAIACMRTVARYVPDDSAPFSCIGFYFIRAQRFEEAIPELEKGLSLTPTDPMILLNLGFAHTQLKSPLRKIAGYLIGGVDHGGTTLSLFQLAGKTLAELGDIEEAERVLNIGFERTKNPLLKLQATLLLHSIYPSNEVLEAMSTRYREGIEAFQPEFVGPIGKEKLPPPFQITYMGKNDRRAQKRLGEIYRTFYPELDWVAPHCRSPRKAKKNKKIKIGFISSYFKMHTIGHLNVGLVEQLDRERFEVVVVRQPQVDEMTKRFDEAADKTVLLDGEFKEIRERIAHEELDILYYTDIGMDSWTYMLAFSRLAHVQTLTWGNPETTGLPYMDYFLSSKDLDIESAQEHYTEQLIRFERLNCYYVPPESIEPKGREHFGWNESENIYLCPQSLFKYFPDFDDIIGEILKRDPKGKWVNLTGVYPEWNEIFLKRFSEKYPEEVERVVFHPRLSRSDFVRINAAADVVLEPIHFGNGNSSLEAFSMNAPVVSMPSEFLRCRITYSQLKKMGVDELIVDSAEAYVELAVKLANDKRYNQSVRDKIAARKHVLFEDREVLSAVEAFLESVV